MVCFLASSFAQPAADLRDLSDGEGREDVLEVETLRLLAVEVLVAREHGVVAEDHRREGLRLAPREERRPMLGLTISNL